MRGWKSIVWWALFSVVVFYVRAQVAGPTAGLVGKASLLTVAAMQRTAQQRVAPQKQEDIDTTAIAEYYRVLPNADTLVYHYWETPWAVHPYLGAGLSYYLGRLRVARGISPITSQWVELTPGSGQRYAGGLLGEWEVQRKKWGVQLAVEYQRYSAALVSRVRTPQQWYELRLAGDALRVEPRFFYYLLPAFRIIGGIGIQHTIRSDAKLVPVFDTTSRITQEWPVVLQPKALQFEATVGAAYRWFLMDIVPLFRVYLVPQVALRFGTAFATQYGGAWYTPSVWFRLGVQLGILRSRLERHPYQRVPERLPTLLASIAAEVRPPFPTLVPRQVGAIAALQEPVIAPPTAPSFTEDTVAAAVTPRVPQPTQPPQVAVKPNEVKRFHYPSPLAVQLTPEMRMWLDQVVQYLRSHPRAQIRIVGHTDNFGTALETQRVSEQRANVVRQYLIQRGIDPGRIFASGQGARFPIADNRTEAGRRLNRRVEIVIVE